MHPYASVVLQHYYKAIGWNEDNLYSNLTRASASEDMVDVPYGSVYSQGGGSNPRLPCL